MATEDIDILIVTEDAKVEIRSTLQSNDLGDLYLRVAIQGGGCSGYTYNMEVVDFTKEGDNILTFEDIKILVDPISAMMLKGTTIDYKKTLQQSGFVFINPNAKRTCGCSKSFS